MANEKTVSSGDMQVIVGPITLRGILLRDALLEKVPDQKEWRGAFIRCMTQTRSSVGLPFMLISAAPDDATFDATYQAFLDLDFQFVSDWIAAAMSYDPVETEADKKKSS